MKLKDKLKNLRRQLNKKLGKEELTELQEIKENLLELRRVLEEKQFIYRPDDKFYKEIIKKLDETIAQLQIIKEKPEPKIPEFPKFPEKMEITNFPQIPKPEIKVETKEVKIPKYPKKIKAEIDWENAPEPPKTIVKTEKVIFPKNFRNRPLETIIQGFKEILEKGLEVLTKQFQKVKLLHRKPEEYIPVRIVFKEGGRIIFDPPWGGGGGISGGPAVPIAWESGSKTVTTAGVPEVLATDTKCQSVTIKAKSTNTGIIKVGGLSSAPLFELAASEQISGDIDNLNKIRIDATVNGEGVTYLYVW